MLERNARGVRPGRSLLQGAALLGAAAVVSKLIGTLQKVPLQNVGGDGVFGIYNAVYPIYLVILTLATAGLPSAVSFFVAERTEAGRADEAKRICRIAAVWMTAAGFGCFALLYFGAGTLSAWMGLEKTEDAIRAVSLALPLVPALAVLRGYDQGRHRMAPSALSQVAEQLVRVGVMVALLLLLTRGGADDGTVAAGAMLGSAAGAAAGLIAMLAFRRRNRRKKDGASHGIVPAPETGTERGPGTELKDGTEPDERAPQSAARGREPAFRLLKTFVRYAVPLSLGLLIVPVLTLADAFSMPRLLMFYGADEAQALQRFGVYHHGWPLVQLVTMIAAATAAPLVPALAAFKAAGSDAAVRDHAAVALRAAYLAGLAGSVGMAVTSESLAVMFYASAEGAGTMAIVAFAALFAPAAIVSAHVLAGLGDALSPARNLLAAAAVKVAGNLLLMPAWGVDGAAAAAVAAYAVCALLNGRSLARRPEFRPRQRARLRETAAAVAACAVMAAAAWAVLRGAAALTALPAVPPLSPRLAATAASLAAVLVGAVVYAAALLRFGAVSARELRALPGIGGRLADALAKWRLLPGGGNGAG